MIPRLGLPVNIAKQGWRMCLRAILRIAQDLTQSDQCERFNLKYRLESIIRECEVMLNWIRTMDESGEACAHSKGKPVLDPYMRSLRK